MHLPRLFQIPQPPPVFPPLPRLYPRKLGFFFFFFLKQTGYLKNRPSQLETNYLSAYLEQNQKANTNPPQELGS